MRRLAGVIAIAFHAIEATIKRRAVLTASPEVAIALTLLAWAVLTIPFSYWPGGSRLAASPSGRRPRNPREISAIASLDRGL